MYPSEYFQPLYTFVSFSGDGPKLRDEVIRNGVLQPLIALIQPETPVSVDMKNFACNRSV